MLRDGLARLINDQQDLAVCGHAETQREALAAINELDPNVVVVDLLLREGHGMELIKEIRSQAKRTPILVFSMMEEAIYAVRAMKAGAQGFVNKQESSERLVSGLRAVLKGEYALSASASRAFLDSSLKRGPDSSAGFEDLGDRELEVFELLGYGAGTREIAGRLGRSIKTVESYRARIKRKLNLKDGNALVREAVRWVESRVR